MSALLRVTSTDLEDLTKKQGCKPRPLTKCRAAFVLFVFMVKCCSFSRRVLTLGIEPWISAQYLID
jgi:hypothetical protein